MVVGHCVCLVNCELGVNNGLIPIVIVIVIGCYIMPLRCTHLVAAVR